MVWELIASKVAGTLTDKFINRLENLLEERSLLEKEEAFKTALGLAFFLAFTEVVAEFFEGSTGKPFRGGVEDAKWKLNELFNLNEEELKKLLTLDGLEVNLEGFNFENFDRNGVLDEIWNLYENLPKTADLRSKLGPNKSRLKGEVKRRTEPLFYELLKDPAFRNLTEYLKNRNKLDRYRQALAGWASDFEKSVLNAKPEDPCFVPLKSVFVEPKFRIFEKSLNDFRNFFREDPPRCPTEDRQAGKGSGLSPVRDGSFYYAKEFELDLENFFKPLVTATENFEFLRRDSAKVVLVLGYPGEGKTSLAKKLAHDYARYRLNWEGRLFLVRLRELAAELAEEDADFFQKPFNTVELFLQKRYSLEVKAPELKRSLLILDGLDELVLSAKATAGQVINLFERLTKQLVSEEGRVVITSRYLSQDLLDAVAGFQGTVVLELREFKEEEVILFLEKFKKTLLLRPEGSDEVFPDRVEELKKKVSAAWNSKNCHLVELLSQPIILTLVTCAFAEGDEKVRRIFEKNAKAAEVYETVIRAVVDRKWDAEYFGHDELKKLYLQFLRELAHYMEVQKGTLQAEYSEVEKLESFKIFVEKLKDSEVDEVDPKELFPSAVFGFYLRTKPKEGQESYTLEFVHKTFQEYLAAEYIYYEVLKLPQKSDEEAQRVIWKLFSHRRLDGAVRQFLEQIVKVKRETDRQLQDRLLERLVELFPELLRKNFFLESLGPDETDPLNRPLFILGGLLVLAGTISTLQLEEKLKEGKIPPGEVWKHHFLTKVWEKDPQNKERFARLLKHLQVDEVTRIRRLPLTGIDLSKVDLT
ncbi:MAG: NACHT domain-containing protein, partial [Aquificae bacterium]|nr:NACHT domain-containing protein [Aquificota bacterium]